MSAVTAAFAMTTTGCLEEAFPESSDITKDQLVNADKSSLAGAIPAYMTSYTSYSSNTSYQYDIGFAGFGIWRDTMTADLPVYNEYCDYFKSYEYTMSLYNTGIQSLFWRRYYYQIHNCDLVIGMSSYDPSSPDAPYMATALAYRAMCYMDLVRLFEYKRTGVPELDAIAEQRGLYGITVPKITETTTEEESRHTVRAPFYEMYRFIMDDLNKAEVCLSEGQPLTSKTYPSMGVVYGLKARMWLEMASRFDLHPEDLDKQVENESNADLAMYAPLGITTAKQCYENAATYARKAINEGYTPVTETQWYDPKSGFNSPNNAWMFCITISSDNGLAKSEDWQSWPSFMSPEPTYGLGELSIGSYRMIDARLFTMINANDWRRDTWIDPNDVGSQSAFEEKYAKTTSLDYATWKGYAGYAGFKWHPANGDINTSTVGNAVSIPLMRVEEMYLIEAEALACSQGVGTGRQMLEAFMNAYRMKSGTTYACSASDLDGVLNAILTQKRIEFWGEGIVLWDYRRREIPIERGYPGTNHFEASRFNSYPNAVAPWTNVCIPERVQNLNPSIPLNPDPSLAIPLWKANS